MCKDMVQDMYIYTQICICTSNVYIHIQACSLMNLNLISNSVQLLYIQYEMSCFMDAKGVKNQTCQVVETQTQSTLLNLEPHP